MATTAELRPVATAPRAPVAAPSRAPRAAWLWIGGFLAWTVLALLSAAETAASLTYYGRPFAWGKLFAWRLVDWYGCAIFIPALYWLVRVAPLERGAWLRRLPLHVAATVVATLARYALMVPVERRFFGEDRTFGAALVGDAITELMIFWAVIGVLHALEFYRRYREREAAALALRAELGEAQLQALRAQLHPHFLFNALNAATALVHRDPDAADAMLTRLGELLRLTLRADPAHETPLRDELRLLDHYLDVMRVRFADRLRVDVDVPGALGGALVPSFLLQPLVENALEHGVARMDGAGRVEIAARRDDGTLLLSVRDDGPGNAPVAREGNGVGLANTRARLAALYGDAAMVTLRPRAEGGTEAELRLPYHEAASS